MFPSGWVNFKLNEVAKFYTEIGFGSITWHGLTINSKKFAKMPKDVQAIFLEVGREYEAMTGKVNKESYPKQLKQLADLGMTVNQVAPSVQKDWAVSLKDWPQQMAKDLDKRGYPGTKTLKIALKEAETLGHKWPVRYDIK